MKQSFLICMALVVLLIFASAVLSSCNEEECCGCPANWATVNGTPAGEAFEYCEEQPYTGDSLYGPGGLYMPTYAWENFASVFGWETWDEFAEYLEDAEEFGCYCE